MVNLPNTELLAIIRADILYARYPSCHQASSVKAVKDYVSSYPQSQVA